MHQTSRRATPYTPHLTRVSLTGCITLIGMAAAGKTTIGRELSSFIDWPQIDSDNLIEAVYGAPLQIIADAMNKEHFLDLEGMVLSTIAVQRAIISTGGSVVYRDHAMQYLRSLGPIIHLAVPLPIILERIAKKPERGLAIALGQTIEDLYHEREILYKKYADFTIEAGSEPPSVYAKLIAEWLSQTS